MVIPLFTWVNHHPWNFSEGLKLSPALSDRDDAIRGSGGNQAKVPTAGGTVSCQHSRLTKLNAGRPFGKEANLQLL